MSAAPLRADPRRRREIGAIGFATPGVILLAIFVGALAVDVGRLAWNKRELQEVADLAAIDAMRAFGQCREVSGDPVAAAQASAVRNGYDGNLAAAPNQVEIGNVSTVNGVRTFTAGGAAATDTALRVFATRRVPFTLIASALLPGNATLQAEAVAKREAVGSLSAGSFAARFDSSDSWAFDKTLGALLGGNVSLSAVSYQGLADANFSVANLMAAANVGTLDELLALQMTGPEYLTLLADAVSDGGSSSAAATLTSLVGSLGAGLTLTLGDVIDVESGMSADAFDAQLNALDMLSVGAQVARGDAAVVLNPLGVTIPGVASATAQLRVVQAPRLAFGHPGRNSAGEWNTTVRTGQVRMAITLALGNLSVLGAQPVSLRLFVEAAQTEAHLASIDCADALDPVHRVVIDAEPGLVRLGIGEYPNFNTSPDPVATNLVNLKLLGITVAKITGFSDIPFQSPGQDLRFDGPFVPQIDEPSDDNTQTIGTPVGSALSNALSTLLGSTQLQVVALGGPLLTVSQKNSALTALTSKLSPVLAALDDPLANLFHALGISVGGADITVLSLGPVKDGELQLQPQLAR